ncbi:Os10g0143866 [Oryza sativa Japonica Group]|uniref:Os10g0143866 protein n=1 Tax=Oryza sativa subsp. japonica TaxID=39947 RepID=A0A0P0XRM2_ORYSJ|nr:Os10g0143866 [Oryza sativa Japonica Group]
MDLQKNKHNEFIEKPKWIEDNISNIKAFTKEDIKGITSNYSKRLGNGKLGKVYKGILDDNHAVVVKKYIHMDSEEEFAKEVIVHSQINHKNIVRLIGYCTEKNNLMMVMEYMSNGDLDYHLHVKNSLDSLDIRLNIAIDCADALGYMHSMCSPVLHGDVKPSNILLDDSFNAKISDFGISRLLSTDKTHTENMITCYMDPLYYQEGRLTSKSDVYSFGIVLMELITKKRATCLTQALAEGQEMTELLDPMIANESNMKVLLEIEKLVQECLAEDIDRRPDICDVAAYLRMLRKMSQQAPQENFGWHLFAETQNDFKKQSHQGTNIISSIKMVFPRMMGILNVNMAKSENKGTPLYVSGKRIFTALEIKKITGNYSRIIGKDMFTVVYSGILEDNTQVAVKTHNMFERGKWRCANELNSLSELIHKNIINLLGFCYEMDAVILVYELIERGHLCNILHGNDTKRFPLPLDLRLDIAIGLAEGLSYMHSRSKPILHGNIRTVTVLLDDKFVPKISGFGSSKIGEDGKCRIVGSEMGYMDETFVNTRVLTRKSDVYSFGVVLLELITRKRIYYNGKDNNTAINFAKVYEKEGSGRAMFDNEISADKNIPTLEDIGILAMKCFNPDIDKRPEMKEPATNFVQDVSKSMEFNTEKSLDLNGSHRQSPGMQLPVVPRR